jgi:hypothetical protein
MVLSLPRLFLGATGVLVLSGNNNANLILPVLAASAGAPGNSADVSDELKGSKPGQKKQRKKKAAEKNVPATGNSP